MEEREPLRMDIVPERTREGETLWRAEVRDTADGHLVECSALTASPRAAHDDGIELLAAARMHRDYMDAYAEARRLFPAA